MPQTFLDAFRLTSPTGTQLALDNRGLLRGVPRNGATGTGKSSTSGKTVLTSMLRAGYGGLVLTAKQSDIATVCGYCREAGREEPIIFTTTSGHFFDPIFYEWNAGGRNIESLIEVFNTILAIGKKHADTSSDQFWERAVEEQIRVGLVILDLSSSTLRMSRFRLLP